MLMTQRDLCLPLKCLKVSIYANIMNNFSVLPYLICSFLSMSIINCNCTEFAGSVHEQDFPLMALFNPLSVYCCLPAWTRDAPCSLGLSICIGTSVSLPFPDCVGLLSAGVSISMAPAFASALSGTSDILRCGFVGGCKKGELRKQLFQIRTFCP